MNESLKIFVERVLPDAVIAIAACGTFIFLAGVVLISILFDNVFERENDYPVTSKT